MKSCHAVALFSFISRFPSVEHGPGGIYLSGQSSNPANRRHLRIDPSARVGRSFSEFRTCCVGQSCASWVRESGCTEDCAASSKTRDLGGQSTSIKTVRYGGGHKSFDDHGYDCSGTISYVLGAAGLISTPMSSTEFRSYGERGPGKWITIHAREGHTFAVIAGLRLDTTPYDHYTSKWAPRWQTIYRPPRGFDARHPVGL
jgi:hypothetical protein